MKALIFLLIVNLVLCRRRYNRRGHRKESLRKDEISIDICTIFEQRLLKQNDYGGNIGNKFIAKINDAFSDADIMIKMKMVKSYDASIFHNDDSRGYPFCIFIHQRELLCLAEEFWDLSMIGTFKDGIKVASECEIIKTNETNGIAIANSERRFSLCDSRMFSNIISLRLETINLLDIDGKILAEGIVHQIFHILGFHHNARVEIGNESSTQPWDKTITQDVILKNLRYQINTAPHRTKKCMDRGIKIGENHDNYYLIILLPIAIGVFIYCKKRQYEGMMPVRESRSL